MAGCTQAQGRSGMPATERNTALPPGLRNVDTDLGVVQEWLSRLGARLSLGPARPSLSRPRPPLCPLVPQLGGGKHRTETGAGC